MNDQKVSLSKDTVFKRFSCEGDERKGSTGV